MTRYAYEQTTRDDMVLDCLRDTESGAEIRIAPQMGLHWTNWIVQGTELLWTPEEFFCCKAEDHIPAGGSPLLFPAVGRTSDLTVDEPVLGQYRLKPDGRVYEMPIHGFGPSGTWTLLGHDEVEDEAGLRYRFELSNELQERCYPFDLDFFVTYGLKHESAFVAFAACGKEEPAPFAFGIHPYFLLSKRDKVTLRIPTRHACDLRKGLGIPVEPDHLVECEDYAPGLTVDLAQNCDRVLRNVTGHDMSLTDETNGRCIGMHTSPIFDNCVIYTDSSNPTLCVEPWTSGIGGFCHLHDSGNFRRSGMPLLQAGGRLDGRIDVFIAEIGN